VSGRIGARAGARTGSRAGARARLATVLAVAALLLAAFNALTPQHAQAAARPAATPNAKPGTTPNATPAGAIVGYQGLCLDDRSASTADGNPVQVYTCNGTAAQQWTVASDGTLRTLGKCLDVAGAGTADGTAVDLYTCNGTVAQVWQPRSDGELVNPDSGKCLDDTGYGGSGTQAQIWSCAGTANQTWTLPTATAPGNTPALGPNVYVFDTSMSTTTIQNDIDAVYATQESNQFGNQRYELMFEPGTYDVSVPVGFYTEVVGLGQNPSQTVITGGGIHADAAWSNGNATQNFWRGVENITIDPSSGSTEWAVSQASPMRRVNIDGNLVLDDDTSGNTTSNWSSGGFLGDSVVTGQGDSGTQQQFLYRNDRFGGYTGSNWNMVFVGTGGAPAQSFPSPPYTTVDRTPVVREKPFLTTDGKGGYRVFVPAVRRDSTGTTWGSGRPAAGRSLPLSLFHVARPGDSAASINEALALGRHLLLTPGVYPLSSPLRVNRPGTVVLGLGLATLRATRGNALIEVADVGGVSVAGVLLEAGSAGSPALLRVGRGRSAVRHDLDPTVLFDVYARIGGAVAGGAAVSVQIDSNDVICDNLWLWRADHGEDGTVGWAVNPADTGFLVNGDRVTAYGLAVEHYQKYEVLWNGNHGRTYFFQNEHPYDVPTQAAWVHGGTNGYAAYKVGDHVTDHQAWGLGSYCYFDLNANIYTDRAYEVPDTPGVVFTDLMIVCLNGAGGGGILHCVNDAGGPVENGFGTYFMKRYSNGAGA
jgi:hypothetical protein